MARNLFVIFILAGALAIVLYLKPWITEDDLPPRIYDRLPEGEVIGQSDVLELSRELSKTLYYYKVPFRDFLSPDFLLSQGKNYGLNFQEPVYFYANEKNNTFVDGGIMVSIRDSSKVLAGINYFKKVTTISEEPFLKTKIYRIAGKDISMVYGVDWLFVFFGKNYKPVIKNVLSVKRNEILPKWREFFNQKISTDRPIHAQLHIDKLEEFGIESAMLSMTNDSSSLTFHTVITQFDTLSFQLKEKGPSFEKQAFTKNLTNLHFDINRLKSSENDPIAIILKKLGGKVNFPTEKFLQHWNGDVSYRQGGYQTIKEKYITTDLDENFEVSEVVKFKDVKISGFDLYISMDDPQHTFLATLMDKGLITESENKYRFLYSPPFYIRKSDTSLMFHTSKYRPKIFQDSSNTVLWTLNYTPVQFYIDSTKTKTLYGHIQIPLQKLIADYIHLAE